MYFLGQASTYKFRDVLRHTFAVGKKSDLNELRAYLAAHYGTTKDRVALYHTGRTALTTALKKLVPAGSEVLATSLTCFAVYEAISEAGCIPVFADIDQEKLHFGEKELKTALRFHPEVKAVIVQNNLGIPCDIKSIEKICKKYGLVLIEDLAHSMGIRYADGREAGTVGDAVILSFGKGKAIDTISGGAVIFTSPDSPTLRQPDKRPRLSDRWRDRWYPFFGWQIRGFYHLGNLGRLFTSLLLKLHFIERSADAELDTHTRITYWQAKLALKKIKKLPRGGKKPIRDFYFVDYRDELLAELEKAGYVFDDIWYSCPVSPVRYYRRVNFPESECPVAVWAAEHLINVPTWYPKRELKPALRLIERYLVPDDDDTPEPEEEEYYEEEEEEYYSEPEERETLLDEAIMETEEDAANEPTSLDEAIIETSEEDKTEIVSETYVAESTGAINYSELVYDKFEHAHLNRTNILDKNINSDGTTVSLTKEERRKLSTIPLKNNLPKIRQYQRPKKGPETTEGKVW